MEEKPDKVWKHALTPGLVIILTKFGEAVNLKHENKIHMQQDLSLSNTEFANYQKLRLFGLIAHYKENGEVQRGYWLLTWKGSRFLKNQLPIHRSVKTLNNSVIARDVAQVFISDVWEEYRLHQEKFQGLWLGELTEAVEQKQLSFSGINTVREVGW